METPNYSRYDRLIDQFLDKYELNLVDKCVLTEAATGFYWTTPILAAKAGAKVFAYARDSSYSSAIDSIKFVQYFARLFGVEDKIIFITELTGEVIAQADIITNSFSIRPIDENFIKKLKKTAVISLMYEAWEFRKTDLDLLKCIENEILVLGVNENDDKLPIFKNVQTLLLKMLFENNLEVCNNNFILISRDKFGDNFETILKACNANVFRLSAEEINNNIQNIKDIDAIIIAEYVNDDIIISDNGELTAVKINEYFPGVLIFNFSGNVDSSCLKRENILCYPNHDVGTHKMAQTFTHLGIKPVLELMGAGLKVGEIMHSNRLKYDYNTSKEISLNYFLCQDFKKLDE